MDAGQEIYRREIPDPKHVEPADFNRVKDFIEEKVKGLLKVLEKQR